MPIYMDIHFIPGIEAINVAEAHLHDMQMQKEYKCNCMTYWVDPARGTVFCLIDAPDKPSVEEMHRHSHGMVPNKVIEVRTDVVESFLGRIHDPEEAETSPDGLKIFSDPAFRVLLVTDTLDPILLRHKVGVDKASALIREQAEVIRNALWSYDGREVEHPARGFVASFYSGKKAMACAQAISNTLSPEDKSSAGLRIVINAGEPVAKSDLLFGDTIRLANRLCTIPGNDRIIVASAVRNVLARDNVRIDQDHFMILSPQDESFVDALFNQLEKYWPHDEFAVPSLCQNMSMSKSQLYRKTTALWGLPPNLLLRDFRLDKARELLKKQSSNVSQATFDSGFSSPSYFTKCFKKKFGLLPANYLHSLRASAI